VCVCVCVGVWACGREGVIRTHTHRRGCSVRRGRDKCGGCSGGQGVCVFVRVCVCVCVFARACVRALVFSKVLLQYRFTYKGSCLRFIGALTLIFTCVLRALAFLIFFSKFPYFGLLFLKIPGR
jgi:hypothetical protein